ncbi:DUF4199 domain-containing protein [Terrimonas alba]|uniref:DUF4199 domain-containing protein n=1 Tax=Terrimonas alba TaxID=3349636 RepID=UPI0035F4D2E0
MNKLTPLVKGIITGAAMVSAFLVAFYTVPENSPVHYFIYALFAAGIIWTLISYKMSTSFTGKFADLFGQGFRCFIIAILIIVAFITIFHKFHPEFAEKDAVYYREALVKKKGKTPAEIDELVADNKKRYTTKVVYLTIFGYLILGTIVTAAGSALLMRRK